MAEQPAVDEVDALVAANLAAREAALSPRVARSAGSRGRERPEQPPLHDRGENHPR